MRTIAALLILVLMGAGVAVKFNSYSETVPYCIDLENDARYGPTTPDLYQFLPELVISEELPPRPNCGFSQDRRYFWEHTNLIIPEKIYRKLQRPTFQI